MNKYIILFIVFLTSCTSVVEIRSPEVTSISTTTSTTSMFTPTSVQTSEIISERSYRGVLRTSIYQNIPLVYDFQNNYFEETITPEHEYMEYFHYDIKFPVIKKSFECSELVNSEINQLVNALIEDTKSVLEVVNPEEAVDEWGGFREDLSVKYDIIEISSEVISIFISYSTYSFGAAHPISNTIALNFFTADCSKFLIKDLFDTSIDDYENVIAKEMQNQLCSNLATQNDCDNFLSFTDPFPLLSELLDCCSDYGISEFGIFIQFWEYEVSGPAQGEELILLPWYDLVPVLNKFSKYTNILEKYSERSWLASNLEPSWEFTGFSTYQFGLYGFWDFIDHNSLVADDILFSSYIENYGSESGSYLYKESWWDAPEYVYDGLMQEWCRQDGFTKEECDETATFEWDNPNILEGIKINENNQVCGFEINKKIQSINERYYVKADWHGNPKPRYQGRQELTYNIPKLDDSISNNYFSFIATNYDDPGGTARGAFLETYTFDLNTCEEIAFLDLYKFTVEEFVEILIKYIEIQNDVNSAGNIVKNFSLSESYLFENQFFTENTLYTVLWDCKYCEDFVLEFENELPFSLGRYVVAIPINEFEKYKTDN
jgi:hypothetical protein